MTAIARKLPPHGTRPRYQAGCDCDKCRAANAAYAAERRYATGATPMKRGRTCGVSGYLGGHRCDVCRVAYRDYRREKRHEANA